MSNRPLGTTVPFNPDIRTTPAPVATGKSTKHGYWNKIFSSMEDGNWFYLNDSDKYRVRVAANKHLGKGRFDIYKDSTGNIVFLKKKATA